MREEEYWETPDDRELTPSPLTQTNLRSLKGSKKTETGHARRLLAAA